MRFMRLNDSVSLGARLRRRQDHPESDADSTPPESGGPGSRMTPVSRFGGERIVNARGEALGVLHDVVIDGDHSRIAYAIVAAGGFMGVGERLYVVPWTAVSKDLDADATYVVEADDALLAAAPELEGGRWPDGIDQAWH